MHRSSVSAMLQKLNWDTPAATCSSQSSNAVSHSSRSGSYSCCCVPATSTYLHQSIRSKVHADPVQYKYLQSIVLSSHNQPVEHSVHRCVPTVTWQLHGLAELQPVYLFVSGRVFISSHKHCFYLVPVHPVITALFNFHCTQLFSACGAILLSIELAPFLEDEDDLGCYRSIGLGLYLHLQAVVSR